MLRYALHASDTVRRGIKYVERMQCLHALVTQKLETVIAMGSLYSAQSNSFLSTRFTPGDVS